MKKTFIQTPLSQKDILVLTPEEKKKRLIRATEDFTEEQLEELRIKALEIFKRNRY